MKALEFAIKIENWEMASLCLLLGWFEALRAVPADSYDALLDELAGEETAGDGRRGGGESSRRVEEFTQDALRRAEAIQLSAGFARKVRQALRQGSGEAEECAPRRHGRLRGQPARGAG